MVVMEARDALDSPRFMARRRSTMTRYTRSPKNPSLNPGKRPDQEMPGALVLEPSWKVTSELPRSGVFLTHRGVSRWTAPRRGRPHAPSPQLIGPVCRAASAVAAFPCSSSLFLETASSMTASQSFGGWRFVSRGDGRRFGEGGGVGLFEDRIDVSHQATRLHGWQGVDDGEGRKCAVSIALFHVEHASSGRTRCASGAKTKKRKSL